MKNHDYFKINSKLIIKLKIGKNYIAFFKYFFYIINLKFFYYYNTMVTELGNQVLHITWSFDQFVTYCM